MSLATRPPESPFPKLPTWDAVSLAYASYFRQLPQALRASWLWLILVAVVTAVDAWLHWSWMAKIVLGRVAPGQLARMPFPPIPLVLIVLPQLVLLLGGVGIAVAWHRLLILDERPGFSGSNLATAHLWRYVLVGIVLLAIIVLPGWAMMASMPYFVGPPFNPHSDSFLLFFLLFFALYAIGTAVALRLSLLLPARAVGNTGLTYKQTWDRTRGNTGRLFWGLIITMVPPLLVPELIFVAVSAPPRPNEIAGDIAVRMTITSAVFSVLYLLALPISIGFLSYAYRHFFAGRPEAAE